MNGPISAQSTMASINTAMPRRILIAALAVVIALSIVAVCFAGYLTPAALLSVLSGITFCG
jgi:hypothetical protein